MMNDTESCDNEHADACNALDCDDEFGDECAEVDVEPIHGLGDFPDLENADGGVQ